MVKVMVFPVIMYGCESWWLRTKELMLLNCGAGEDSRVSWTTARRSNQPILKEVNPEYSLEGLILKLKLQYFGHLIRRVNSLEKTLMLGKTEGKRKRGQQTMRWLDSNINFNDNTKFNEYEFEQTPRDSEGQRSLMCCSPWGRKQLDKTE